MSQLENSSNAADKDGNTNSMLIHQKVQAMLTWLACRSGTFPRAHRHGLTARVLDKAMDLHDELIAARHLYGNLRVGALTRADIALDQLRQYLTMSWKMQWLSNDQYRHICEMNDEIGKLLGGWKRSLNKGHKR